MNSATNLRHRQAHTPGGPTLVVLPSVPPSKSRAQRLAERWLVVLMIGASVAFAIRFGSHVLSPAAQTLSGSGSSSAVEAAP